MEVAFNNSNPDDANQEHQDHVQSQQAQDAYSLQGQSLQGAASMQATVTRLQDYEPPAYTIPMAAITVNFEGEEASVASVLQCERAAGIDPSTPLVLQGEGLPIESLSVNGVALTPADYEYQDGELRIPNMPDQAEVRILTRERPADNKSGEGLYKTGEILTTQMEAEGFRKFTFFSDRPDVLTTYTTTLIADPEELPVLLSNGNLVDDSVTPDGKRSVTWEDPFPKPAYLFAVVAGDLAVVQDTYTTMSGREVLLEIYCEKGREHLCDFALESLKQAMKWDEDVFGLEYDLDRYMIVAVDDFNAGAMENKGLNVFNASYVLADPETATDSDFLDVQSVIAHEYFHNYTGNRVTLRDWFQLTLKEGLTVLRDQEFSSDMNSRSVKRIEDVQALRRGQFPEDAGPNAHPIRPETYVEIDNFYTATVYNKGAEVLRMVQTLVGRQTFIKGVQEYLKRFDGQAVTTEDFLDVMDEVSGHDLTQFSRWYAQAGTPELTIESHYDAAQESFRLTVRQACPPTADQTRKDPFVIPLSVGLLAADGSDLSVAVDGGPLATTHVLEVTQEETVFEFTNVTEEPIPSLLREFSAPVKVHYPYDTEDLTFLLAHDHDAFNRFEASQKVFHSMFERIGNQLDQGVPVSVDPACLEAFRSLLLDEDTDAAFKALAFTPPPLSSIAERWQPFAIDKAIAVRDAVYEALVTHMGQELEDVYHDLHDAEGPYELSNEAVGNRSLQNRLLGIRVYGGDALALEDAYTQYTTAENMTNRLAAFSLLVDADSSYREEVTEDFYQRYQNHPQVMDKWIAIQAAASKGDVLQRIQDLQQHEVYDRHSPNKIRSLLRSFAANMPWFHKKDGSGYRVLTDAIIEVDAYNSNVAASLAKGFHRYAQLDAQRKDLMKTELERILLSDDVSSNVFEIVSKTLKSA